MNTHALPPGARSAWGAGARWEANGRAAIRPRPSYGEIRWANRFPHRAPVYRRVAAASAQWSSGGRRAAAVGYSPLWDRGGGWAPIGSRRGGRRRDRYKRVGRGAERV
eukprot:scaffold527_cov368-Prasinococcus_capsulatus_cf.AAC.1